MFAALTLGEFSALHRKMTIWLRVQTALGSNVVLDAPEVMPFSAAHTILNLRAKNLIF
jgi:hypothetical protein